MKALDEKIRDVVEKHAEQADFQVGFLTTAAQELDFPYKKLSHVLTTHVNLRKWWARFKVDLKKKRRAAARKRRNERDIALGRTPLF